MSDSADEDLRDVFKLLYDDNNDWGGFDDDVSILRRLTPFTMLIEYCVD